jgi:hypothetical protein
MELPRLLSSFAMALATATLASWSSAQSITIDNFPDRDPGQTHDISGKEYWITYDDCVNDEVFTFKTPVSGSDGLNLEVWASDGGSNCADVALREGGSARCWQVYASDAANREMQVEIRAQDLVTMSYGNAVQNQGTAQDCAETDINSAGLSLTLYFMLISNDTPAVTATYTGIGLDLKGPEPPAEVDAEPGESKLKVSWSLDDADDWEGYKIFCLPVEGDTVATPALRPLAAPPANGGAGGAATGGTATTTGGTAPATGGAAAVAGGANTGGAGTTSSETGLDLINAECRMQDDAANLLVPGELPSEEVLALECGSGSSNFETDGTATGLQNGVSYQVAVAGVDIFDNVGPLSMVDCDIPAEVDTFYEQYKQAGGKGGGGFCAFSTTRTPGFLTLLGGAALVFAARRRRRRHG